MRKVGRPKNPLSRERLLDAAAAQFARGYHAASMADIARACGIHKSSLFHHFASKEALYLEVVGDYIGRLGALVLAATGPGDFLGRLDRLGEVVTDFLGEHPHAAALLLRELMDEGPYVRLVGLDGVRHVVRMVSGFLAAGMAEGVIAPQDPRQLALSIWSPPDLVRHGARHERGPRGRRLLAEPGGGAQGRGHDADPSHLRRCAARIEGVG